MRCTGKMTLREVFQARPRAVAVLEAATNGRCWTRLDYGLAEFLSEEGLEPVGLMARLDALAPAPPRKDWSRSPLYEVVDRLAEDHAVYRERILPCLEALASPEGRTNPAETAFLAEVDREIHAFKIDFLLHMQEEESYLFPKALRTEACLRQPDLSPEIHTGSVDAFPETLLQVPEERVEEMLVRIRKELGKAGGGPAVRALAERVDKALRALEADLRAHAALETQVLIPRVRSLEADLGARVRREFELDA